MIAVYSFWAEPFRTFGGGYHKPLHFLCFLVKSVSISHEVYSQVRMHTDSYSKPLFEDLGIFHEVIDSMGPIEKLPIRHWAASKLITYSLQNEPFMHIDNDAWFGNPSAVSEIVVQCPEPRSEFGGTYKPQIKALEDCSEAPPCWIKGWYDNHKGAHLAYNTGVVGGLDWKFLSEYGYDAYQYLLRNPDLMDINTTIEQAYLAVRSKVAGKKVSVLMPNWRDKASSKAASFRHFWGGTKRAIDPITKKFYIEPYVDEVKTRWPDIYEICLQISKHFEKK